ncbi:MAG: efflux RND transporter periplasmic adaptor subunit [Sulfurimonas sp.]|nr:efflux RND transporter periplasmic adaptor subunit [Sulfurimonas sp.]MDQ7061013.1 efflux RND transporter periplasmic adaptor subunit [Sulfurimonas sp.]
MNKVYILLLLSASLFSVEIPLEHVEARAFGKSVGLNSKVIQLSNAKQSVTSLMSGHLEKYFVEPGQNVKSGQKIALIESIVVSKMTANYISYKKQLKSLQENYNANNELYKKGMLALQKLNTLSIDLNAMKSNIIALESQLNTLGINTKRLKKATSNFILYAHSAGQVSQLLLPLHTVVREDEALISIVKDQAFYVQSYLPLKYAGLVRVGQKLVVKYNNRNIVTHITQILPELDFKTQRVVVLSSIDEQTNDLFVNTFVESTLYFEAKEKYTAVKKSALSFFNNEWVVFVPTEEEGHEEHGEYDGLNHEEESHEGHGHDDGHKEETHEEHGHDESEEEGNEEHGEHEEESAAYEARVIQIITQDENYVAVKGIKIGEEYVSGKSYFVKSMMLKSSLGEHGH